MSAQQEKTEGQPAPDATAQWMTFIFTLLTFFPPLILIDEDVTAPLYVAVGVLYIAWLVFVGLVAAIVGLLRG